MRYAALLLAFLCAGQALAQPASDDAKNRSAAPKPSAAAGSSVPRADPEEARRLFRELDRNRDGYLSGDELSAQRGRDGNWAAVDRNRDGRISPDEFTALPR